MPGQIGADRGGGDLGLRIGAEPRFRHRRGDGGVAHDMDMRDLRRLEAVAPDRHPAAGIRHPGTFRDPSGLLRRHRIQHIGLVDLAEGGFHLARLRIDANDLPVIHLPDPFDHLAIKRRPALLEQPLFREAFLAVQQQDLRGRLMRLQVMRHHRGALIGSRRTTEGAIGDRHDKASAILHRLQLRLQGLRLRPGLPGMQRQFRRRLVIAFQRIPAEIDPRRQHQPVIRQRGSILQHHPPRRAIDILRHGMNDLDPRRAQIAVTMRDAVPVPQSAQIEVRERAGHETLGRLDQGDPHALVPPPQTARRGRPAETATDHDDMRRPGIGPHQPGQRQRPQPGHPAQNIASGHAHCSISENQRAKAAICASS